MDISIWSVVEVFLEYYPLFFEGLLKTLYLAMIAVVCGTIIGSIIAILGLLDNKIIGAFVTVYRSVIRGTPILVQLYIAYYFIPMAIPSMNDLPKELFIIFALVINSSAYVSEIIRSGINAVDKGQAEAARSLGMTSTHCMVKIIFPQAIKNILPALGNEYIMMIKETSLASTLALSELMYTKTILANKFIIWQPLFIIAFIYMIVTLFLEKVVSYMEKRLSVSD